MLFALETPRLVLRPFTPDDVDDLHRLWTEAGVRKYLWDDEIIPRNRVASIIESSTTSFETNGYGLWAAFSKSEGALIGFCGFWLFHTPAKLELLYGVSPAHWRKGLASEIARSLLRYGFAELSFKCIEASTDAANVASTKVMEKVGMSFRKRENTGGLDTVYYAISREEFHLTSNNFMNRTRIP